MKGGGIIPPPFVVFLHNILHKTGKNYANLGVYVK